MGNLSSYDFAGVVTMPNVKCTDGTTIGENAFASQNGKMVDVRIEHSHNPEETVGDMILHSYKGGIYGYGFFNNTALANEAKDKVKNGELPHLSVSARCKMNADKVVQEGFIREVSLVHKGANSEAIVERVVQHTAYGDFNDNEDGSVDLTFIFPTEETLIEHSFNERGPMTNVSDVLDTLTSDQIEVILGSIEHGDVKEEDEDVLETLTDEQLAAILELIDNLDEDTLDELEEKAKSGDKDESEKEDKGEPEEAVDTKTKSNKSKPKDESTKKSKTSTKKEVKHSAEAEVEEENEGDNDSMKPNSFDATIDHSAANAAIKEAISTRATSLAQVMQSKGIDVDIEHGLKNIDTLFKAPATNGNDIYTYNPQAKSVEEMLSQYSRSPFSRVKNLYYNISEDEARARGYIAGNQTLDSIGSVFYREVTPTSITYTQALDDDDLIDIQENGIDALKFLKDTSKIKMSEELVRATFVKDGRPARNTDGSRNIEHISEENIIPITEDKPLYTIQVKTNDFTTLLTDLTRNRAAFQGTGTPTLFINPFDLQKIKLITDKNGRFLYSVSADSNAIPDDTTIAAKFGCAKAVPYFGLPQGTIVIGNLVDYKFGAANGGQVANFDQFDIDLFQHKTAAKARVSGAIATPKSFICIKVTNPDAVSEDVLKFNTDSVKSVPSFTTDSSTGDNEQVPGKDYASTNRYESKRTKKPAGGGVSPTPHQ